MYFAFKLHAYCFKSYLKSWNNYLKSGSRTSYFKIGKEQVNISRIVVPPATPVTDYSDPKPPKKVATPKIRPHTAVGTKRR